MDCLRTRPDAFGKGDACVLQSELSGSAGIFSYMRLRCKLESFFTRCLYPFTLVTTLDVPRVHREVKRKECAFNSRSAGRHHQAARRWLLSWSSVASVFFCLALCLLPQAHTQCVLCQTGLSFTGAVAGLSVPLTVQFRFEQEIRQGDTVQVKLPGFSRADNVEGELSSILAFFPPYVTVRGALVAGVNGVYKIRQTRTLSDVWVDALMPYFVLPTDTGLVDIYVHTGVLTGRCTTNGACVAGRWYISKNGVQVYESSTLTGTWATATGAAAAAADDLPTVTRDGKTAAGASMSLEKISYAFDGNGFPSPAFSAVSWNESSSILTLHHINPIRIVAKTLLKVTVRQTSLIRLPASGAKVNNTDFVIRAVAATTTTFQPFDFTEPIGALYNTSLAFFPALPLTTTSFSLNFTSALQIEDGGSVTLELNQFTVNGVSVVSCNMTTCSDGYGLGKKCSDGVVQAEVSYTGQSVIVVFKISDTIAASDMVTVTVPQSAGIVTSKESERHFVLHKITAVMSIGSTALFPSSVEVSNEIPRASISYGNAKVATGECTKRPLTSETIFRESAPGYLWPCTAWQDETVTIDVNIVLSKPASMCHELVLMLPGFSRKEARQMVPSAPITRLPCNGTCDGSLNLTGSTSSQVSKAVWHENTGTMRLIFNAKMPSGSLVSVTVPASAGFRLPTDGLAENDPRITWKHVSSAGNCTMEACQLCILTPENSTAALTSPAVGAFVSKGFDETTGNSSWRSSSALILSDDLVGGQPLTGLFRWTLSAYMNSSQCIGFCGTRVGVPLPFSTKRDFMGPVTVSFLLPGFTRASGNLDHFDIPGTPLFAQASWIEGLNTLVLTATAQIAANTEVSVQLPENAGILLPEVGVMKNTVDLQVATNLLASPVRKTAIAETSAVGAVMYANFSISPPKAGVPVTLKFFFSFSFSHVASQIITITLPGFFRALSLDSALSQIDIWENGVKRSMFGSWRSTGDSQQLLLTVGARGLLPNSQVSIELPRNNQIYLRESGLPTVKERNYWRVVNNSEIKQGWSVAEVTFYSDTTCKARIPQPSAINSFLASSGQGIQDRMNCSSFKFATNLNNKWACPEGYRLARFGEMASCKLSLCDVKNGRLFLVAQGDGAHVLGAGHGCQILAGSTDKPNPDSICLPKIAAAYNAFDGQSATSWSHVPALTSIRSQRRSTEAYVGIKYDSLVAVLCVTIEQERFETNWTLSSVAVQSSRDGIDWATVFEGTLTKGMNFLFRPKGASDSTGFDSITVASSASRGPFKNARVFSMPIGAFSSSSLSFGNPVRGRVTNISITVTPEMEIDVGETISVKLNGISGGPNLTNSIALLARYDAPVFDGKKYGFVERLSYNPRSSAPCMNTRNDTQTITNYLQDGDIYQWKVVDTDGNGCLSLQEFWKFSCRNGFCDNCTCVLSQNGQPSLTFDQVAAIFRLYSNASSDDDECSSAQISPLDSLAVDEPMKFDTDFSGCISQEESSSIWNASQFTAVLSATSTGASPLLPVWGFYCNSAEISVFRYLSGKSYSGAAALIMAPPPSTNCSASLNQPQGPLFNASWNSSSKVVTITMGAVIYPGHELAVTLLDTNLFILPVAGIVPSACGTGATVGPLTNTLGDGSSVACGTCLGCDVTGINENTFTISSNAKAGAVLQSPPTVVRRVQRIGSFNTSISFSALTDAYPVNISVNFRYSLEFIQGDKVYLHLPGFSSASNIDSTVFTFGPDSSALATASWDRSADRVVITVTNKTIAALTRVRVVIPASAGVIMRSDGLIKNSGLLKISTNAKNGPVPPMAIDSSPAMGSFSTGEPSSMSYYSPELESSGRSYAEGRIAAFTVGFSLNRVIKVGERIFLGLEGFSRDAGDIVSGLNASAFDRNFSTVDTMGAFSSFMAASWVELSHRLTLTASKQIPAYQRHVVFIPTSAGLRIPRLGFKPNDRRLTIGTDAEEGPNSGTPIAQSPMLHEVCGAECGAWAFTCGTCRCGPCYDQQTQ